MALKKCKDCGEKVSKKADSCPKCGSPVKRKSIGCGGLIVALVFLAIMGSVISSFQESSKKATEQRQQAELAQRLKDAGEKARVDFEKNIVEHYAKLENFVKNKDFSGAISLLDNFKKHNQLPYKDVHEIDKLVRTNFYLKKLKTIPTENAEENLSIYNSLVVLNPLSQKYITKRDHYQKIITEKERKLKAETERNNQIEKQFSGWDNSHRNLEKVIKKSMNDPSSYEHVKTNYWDKGGYLIVQTTFRGKNAFGAVVKNWVKAKVDLHGNVLNIIEQGP
ncbi:MAG: hypothetical protein OEY01_10905 [Desulfobulbaceae bacterium]|nr:hypothetical protein [Desulfobulbaceae bacterium]